MEYEKGDRDAVFKRIGAMGRGIMRMRGGLFHCILAEGNEKEANLYKTYPKRKVEKKNRGEESRAGKWSYGIG